MTEIGTRIREARIARGWSQNELASRASVKQPTLQRIEAGLRRDPSVRTVAAIARALAVSVDSLIGYDPVSAAAEASPQTSDAIEALTHRLAELERRFDTRIATLESNPELARLRNAT